MPDWVNMLSTRHWFTFFPGTYRYRPLGSTCFTDERLQQAVHSRALQCAAAADVNDTNAFAACTQYHFQHIQTPAQGPDPALSGSLIVSAC